MARVGIDFGTTNTVVALADRGNYPVLELGRGADVRLALPSILAWNEGRLRVGLDAEEVWGEPGWRLIASPKRCLGVPEPEILQPGVGIGHVGSAAGTGVSAGGSSGHGGIGGGPGDRLEGILVELFRHLREALMRCPHLEGDSRIEAMIGVPANANSLQRLRTLEVARRAGFEVLGLVHEPTASAIEYSHRHPGFGGRGKEQRHVAVYDLGGGTFDASVVRVDAAGFAVVRSGGVERLGGDDFDLVMAEMSLEKAGARWDHLSWSDRFRLLRRCAQAKETIQPTTRKFILDLAGLGGDEVVVTTSEYYEACAPLVERTMTTLDEMLGASGVEAGDIDALLVVGGGSQMALVRRRLRERFGSRLKISPHPFASVAVGLAVQAERAHEQPIEERLGRSFGVWREAEAGGRQVFDPIFHGDTRLPPAGATLSVTRAYAPAHDIGHFRFEECAQLDAGAPVGQRAPWCEIRFPFDPDIGANEPLEHRPVVRTERFSGQTISEAYECDWRGIIKVRIERSHPRLTRSYLLYGPEQVAPIRRRRVTTATTATTATMAATTASTPPAPSPPPAAPPRAHQPAEAPRPPPRGGR